jgi:hypothetical protein
MVSTDLSQVPDLLVDLIYLKVSYALPVQILHHFSVHPYHEHFLEVRVNTLCRPFIAKVETALIISGLLVEDFVINQILAERLSNPFDPFRLGRDFRDEGPYHPNQTFPNN